MPKKVAYLPKTVSNSSRLSNDLGKFRHFGKNISFLRKEANYRFVELARINEALTFMYFKKN